MNQRTRFRKPLLYPLSYGGAVSVWQENRAAGVASILRRCEGKRARGVEGTSATSRQGARLAHAAGALATSCRHGVAAVRPTFLIVGAQKAGTTSLHAYLARHPDVLSATRKEVEYFSRHYANGEAWYLAHFPLSARALVRRLSRRTTPAVGEASATYLFHPLAHR